MELIDVLGRENWQKLLDDLSEQYGITVSLMDGEAKVLLKSGELNVLCTAIREKPENRTFICAQSARGMTGEAMETLQPVNEFCDAGLMRFTVPVVRDGKFIGQVGGCGIITDRDEIMPEMLARQMDRSEEETIALIDGVRVVDEEAMARAIDEIVEKIKE